MIGNRARNAINVTIDNHFDRLVTSLILLIQAKTALADAQREQVLLRGWPDA